ncbi:MAG TPA: hypothetical protein VMF53_15530, partial [Alphaproteobacteria bacterium]|nr:hypothetical protein [Alphaproteobacteria bacterium]
PRPHFYATAGRNMLDKVANFARAAGGSLFFWLMVPAVLLTLACRAIELWALLRTGRPGGLPLAPTLYLAAIAGYIVMITGPVAGVGYRIELEPFLAILLASGLLRLWRRGDGSTSRA